MIPELTEVEARIVGSLIEKEMTTPEYYPLTLNSLVNACNQKSNRDPVMSLSEKDVEDALEELKERRLVWQMNLAGSRVPKFEHNLKSLFPLDEKELALIAVLMLRGPQTTGELRTRTERMASFESVSDVEMTLEKLKNRQEETFVAELPRRTGQKENRYIELFSRSARFEEQDLESEEQVEQPEAQRAPQLAERVSSLELEVQTLKAELNQFKTVFNEFRKEFE